MLTMGFKVEKMEERKEYPGKIVIWIRSSGYPVDKSDVDAFLLHYKKYSSIPHEALTREIYETLCKTFDLEPLSDADILEASYGNKYGDFGMDHYFYPENRQKQLWYILRQRRSWSFEKETPEILYPYSDLKVIASKEGQLWESCDNCGQEPVYLPLHLCDKCWPL